jgi:hypothetical protein
MRVCRAVIAASLVMAACAPSARQPARGGATQGGTRTILVVERLLHGDTRFDAYERKILERACLAWLEFTGGRARLQIVWDYGEDNYMQIAAARAPHIKRTDWWYAPPNAGGRVNEIGGGEVRLVPENCPGLYPCALHELGHVLGLEHVADIDAVMSATLRAVRPPSRFTEADRVECARVKLCD